MASTLSKDFAAVPTTNGAPQQQQQRPVDEQDVKNVVHQAMAKDISKGAAVHEFNPDATPEEKAAAAGEAKAQLAAIKGAVGRGKAEGGRAVALDASTANAPKPTVSIADVDKASRAEGEMGGELMPGQIPVDAAPAVPTWMKTGWRSVAGIDVQPSDPSTAAQMSVLADFVSEQAYGAWFHNAGIILFAVLATHLLTLLHLGWGWLLIVLAACSSYYSLSISRTRARARDDIQRELVKTRLVTEVESADFINSFLDRFWLIYEPVLSATIVSSVDAVLATSTPSFLESIRLTTFTLGTKAPRIDSVRTFPKTPDDIVIMDWALSFTPNDIQDITPRQAARRVNPKIVLSIGLGKGFVSKSMPILLEDMSFSGKMRIKLKLMTNFPHVKTIDMSFIEKPTFDYVLKPIGGETFGFDINNIPGLAPFIREQVHANLGPMMYDPNMFTIDLQSLLSGTPLDSAIGVLKVTVSSARGLKATKLGGGDPDAYVSLSLGAKPAIARTKAIESNTHPAWNESLFILVNTLADVLNLNLYDYNEHRPDSHLGTVAFELAALAEDASQEALVGKVLGGGKERGELRYDVDYFPVMVPKKLDDGTVEALPESQTGVVRLTIHQAKELDVTRIRGDLNPSASVYLGGSREPAFTTPVMKHANQPIWEASTEFLVPDRHNSVITIKVTDHKDFASDPSLGTVTVKLSDLLEAQERQQDWFPLKGSRAGKIRLSTKWKPVAMAGSIGGAAAYVPPIGILRVWLKKAIDVKNVEGALGGKSDPYVRVMSNNKILARTEVVNNNLNPEWDQIIYVPVHNLRERLILEVMDYQNLGKDRSLGHVEIHSGDFAEACDDNAYPFRSTGPQNRADPIKLDKGTGYKGKLLYEVSFCPGVSLQGGVSFDAPANELQSAVDAANEGKNLAAPQSSGSAQPSTDASANTSGAVTPADALESNGGGEATAAEDPKQGIVMDTEELLRSKSGVLVLQVISGHLARRGALEVMLDDGYWPAFTTEKARSTNAVWDQIGEGFVRELDFSRIWLRINAHDDSEKEDVVAEYKGDTKEFLEQCIREPQEFNMTSPEGQRSSVKIAARFVPVDIKLEPRESANNMGILRVTVQNATNLLAADRGGKSDPYVAFELDGERVWKSEVVKKTLSPVWDESFEVTVSSRVKDRLTFEVFDWDQIGSSDTLGTGVIDIENLEPLQMTSVSLPVRHHKKGEKGVLNLKLWFSPEIIARTRNKTSTFSTAGRALTQVGAVPFGVGKTVGKGVVHGGGAVVKGVGHGVGNVGGFAGRGLGLIKKKDKSGHEVLVEADESDLAAGQISQPAGTSGGYSVPAGANNLSDPFSGAGPQEPGVLSVTVIGTKDLQGTHTGAGAKAYVQLKMGKQVHKTSQAKKAAAPEWNESYSFNVVPGVTSFTVTVLDHHSIGKDKELGEADVDIWRHIQPAVPNADVLVELGGQGQGLLKLRLDWATGTGPVIGTPKGVRDGRAASISSKTASPSKFSLRSHKDRE